MPPPPQNNRRGEDKNNNNNNNKLTPHDRSVYILGNKKLNLFRKAKLTLDPFPIETDQKFRHSQVPLSPQNW